MRKEIVFTEDEYITMCNAINNIYIHLDKIEDSYCKNECWRFADRIVSILEGTENEFD